MRKITGAKSPYCTGAFSLHAKSSSVSPIITILSLINFYLIGG